MDVEARIKALRLQIMIHSIIYYEMNDNIISDAEWSKRAMGLVELQKANPSVSTVFDEAFKDFDGSTGFHLLSYADDAARGKARYLCEISRTRTGAKKCQKK